MIDYSSDNVANTATNKSHTYHEQNQIDQTLRLREVMTTLPPFVKDYFRAMEPKSSVRTRISYAYDIRVFFHGLPEWRRQIPVRRRHPGQAPKTPSASPTFCRLPAICRTAPPVSGATQCNRS